jgi:glycerol-3-phosphate dehydrogenase
VDEPARRLRLSRSRALEELHTRPFDLLVIGGGIVGAGIAAHAARAGVAVALVDAGDFGGGTSSASSKLIHGGLRYLRLGDIRLVREAHHERRALSNVVAPHLAHRQQFLLPLYEHGPFRPWFVQSGIVLYSTLALSRLHWLVQPDRAGRLVPDLRRSGLRSCALYADAWTNDARLCLENVIAASEAGAVVLNRARVAALRTSSGRVCGAEVEVEGRTVSVAARVVVNAAGPWVDRVRALEDPRAGTSVQLSKGVHVMVPGGEGWDAALTIPQDDVRVTFAVPWYDMLLLGTTDTAYEGDPSAVAATPEDVEQVLREARLALPEALVRPEAVRSVWAGLRVLPVGSRGTASARRETVFSRGSGGMLSVAGGKLTTYRKIALDALGRVASDLGLHGLDRKPWPLPGAASGPATTLPGSLEPRVRANLLHLYGSRAADVVQLAADDPTLLEPLHPDGPDIAAQVVHAVSREWATTVDDVLRRRTTVGWRGLDSDATREGAAALVAAHATRSQPPDP